MADSVWRRKSSDLHVCTRDYALERLEMYRVLVDKDHIMPAKEDTSEERYWVKKPTEREFQCTCMDFWWCFNNVAKEMWRQEIPYVMEHLDMVLRPQLELMMEWKIGMEHQFAVNVGKSGKYLSRYLSREEYRSFLATYSSAEPEAIWKSVFIMCELFDRMAKEVSRELGFQYDPGKCGQQYSISTPGQRSAVGCGTDYVEIVLYRKSGHSTDGRVQK